MPLFPQEGPRGQGSPSVRLSRFSREQDRALVVLRAIFGTALPRTYCLMLNADVKVKGDLRGGALLPLPVPIADGNAVLQVEGGYADTRELVSGWPALKQAYFRRRGPFDD